MSEFVILETLAANLPVTVLGAIGAGLLRNVAGWLENVLKDGKVEKYEFKQLAGTMIKYFSAIALLSLGLPVPEAVAAVFGLDMVASAMKKGKK